MLFPQCSHPCKINRTDLLLVKCTLSFTPDWNGNAKSSAICFQQGAAGKDGALGSSSPGQKPQQEPICPLQQGEGSQHKMGIFFFLGSPFLLIINSSAAQRRFHPEMSTEGCVSKSTFKNCSHKGQVASKQSSQALLPSGMIPL